MSTIQSKEVDSFIDCLKKLINIYGYENVNINKPNKLRGSDCVIMNAVHMSSKTSCVKTICTQDAIDYLKSELRSLDRNSIIDGILADLEDISVR